MIITKIMQGKDWTKLVKKILNRSLIIPDDQDGIPIDQDMDDCRTITIYKKVVIYLSCKEDIR